MTGGDKMNLLQRYINKDLPGRIRNRVLPNLRHLTKSRIRQCRACQRISLFVQFAEHEEFRVCFRCTANLRYEMLAEHIRGMGDLSTADVLELDPASPISLLLSGARSHVRSYYRPGHVPGTIREDGARMEDITRLTFPNDSLDLIVSSDVLEHVPDAHAAFRESFRVLRPGGAHLFTVPNEPATIRRAILESGEVRHLVPDPEYHSDPLDRNGILAFWHFGPDMNEQFGECGLQFSVVRGPEGVQRRILWLAEKPTA